MASYQREQLFVAERLLLSKKKVLHVSKCARNRRQIQGEKNGNNDNDTQQFDERNSTYLAFAERLHPRFLKNSGSVCPRVLSYRSVHFCNFKSYLRCNKRYFIPFSCALLRVHTMAIGLLPG